MLVAASLALNQRGEGSSPSGPTATNLDVGERFNPPASEAGDSLLTTSGYIINRERIELSPRFVGIVRWIGVKKGDPVKKGQVVVLLDDSEQRARVLARRK